MKKIITILICLILMGCAKSPSETVTENVVKDDNIINCPDCDDGDKCTTDICAGEEKRCIHVPIRKCCGNDKCDEEESCETCEEDCGKCYSLQDLQKDINKIYRRKIALAKNRVIGKVFGEIKSPDYDFYDSAFITAIVFKDESNFLSDFEEFKEFIEGISKAKFEIFAAKIAEDYPKENYEYTVDYTTEVTGTLIGDMVKYGYWAKIYQKYRSCAICNNENRSYETKSLTNPVLDGLLYIRCTPNIVIGVYSNQPQMLEKFWTNLDEAEYDAQIVDWIDNEARGAFDEAVALMEYCTGH